VKTLFLAAENGVLGRGNNVFRNKLSPDGCLTPEESVVRDLIDHVS